MNRNLLILSAVYSIFLCSACNSKSTDTTRTSISKDTPVIKDHMGADTSLNSTHLQDSLNVAAHHADTTKKNVLINSKADPNQSAVNYTIPKNTREIIWLRAGLKQGISMDLRAHAKMMLIDHQKLATKINELAYDKQYRIPKFDTANEVTINDKIGPDWDKAWASKMVADHFEMLNLLSKAEKDVTDPKLKLFITATIPIIKSHLDMIEKLDRKLK